MQTQQVLDTRPDRKLPTPEEAARKRLAFARCLLPDGVAVQAGGGSVLEHLGCLVDVAGSVGRLVEGEVRLMPRLVQLLRSSEGGSTELRKEVCWTISNITAGTLDQAQVVIDSGAVPPLLEVPSP